MAEARSEYFAFVGLVSAFTVVVVIVTVFFVRWTVGESAPAVAAVVVTAAALVFGAFGATVARDRSRAVTCLGLAVFVAVVIDAIAFATKLSVESPRLFWAVLGVGFFLVFPILGLARRQGEATYGADLDAIAAKFHKSMESAIVPGRALNWKEKLVRRLAPPETRNLRALTGSGRATQAAGGAGSLATLAVFTAWAEVVASSWLATDEPDAATPAAILASFSSGAEGVAKQLGGLGNDQRDAALRVLFHLKLALAAEGGSLRLTAKGEKLVGG
jgi:hypothetical protein